MAKIKLTKGELKKQRDALKQFRRYLPTLQLKKQQLQMKILETRRTLQERFAEFSKLEGAIKEWVGLLADTSVPIKEWLTPIDIIVKTANIAGVNIPVFDDVHFHQPEYDYFQTPLWLDVGIENLRLLVEALVEIDVIKKQIAILEKELRTTTQRVNLFEKVKIPECLENIRKIGINLGDQQANAVGISKVAKKKVEQQNLEFVGV